MRLILCSMSLSALLSGADTQMFDAIRNGDTAKPQQRRNYGDHKEHQGIVKHFRPPPEIVLAGWIPGPGEFPHGSIESDEHGQGLANWPAKSCGRIEYWFSA